MISLEETFGKNDPPEKRLISAIVGLALRDCTLPPIKLKRGRIRLDTDALTAFDFLFTEACEDYLEFLDIDPKVMRSRILTIMADTSKSIIPFNEMSRRAFRMNYRLWRDLYDRLGRGVFGDEEESLPNPKLNESKKVRRSSKHLF